MKENIFILLSLCIAIFSCNDSNNQKKEFEYYVERMGTLGSMLSQTQKDTITTMIIKGQINKADFEVMKKQMPQLRCLDLKDVKCEGDKIPNKAFGGDGIDNSNKNINTIILPESITTIGEEAFRDCSGFTGDLIIPDGVTTIGELAFDGCSGFTGNLILPDGLTAIGIRAFFGCSGFTGNLILPDGLTAIGGLAFRDCSGFTGNLIIPDGVSTIKYEVFNSCSGLTGLTIGRNLTTIYDRAFYGCNNITGNIVFPVSLTSIREFGFEGCTKVEAFQFTHTTPLKYYHVMLEKSVPVKVPNKAFSTYQSAYGWKEHTIIGY